MLYLQAVAYRDSFEESVEVKMEGDVEAAIEWANKSEEDEKPEDADDDGRSVCCERSWLSGLQGGQEKEIW